MRLTDLEIQVEQLLQGFKLILETVGRSVQGRPLLGNYNLATAAKTIYSIYYCCQKKRESHRHLAQLPAHLPQWEGKKNTILEADPTKEPLKQTGGTWRTLKIYANKVPTIFGKPFLSTGYV